MIWVGGKRNKENWFFQNKKAQAIPLELICLSIVYNLTKNEMVCEGFSLGAFCALFLAQDSSIGDLATDSLTHF